MALGVLVYSSVKKALMICIVTIMLGVCVGMVYSLVAKSARWGSGFYISVVTCVCFGLWDVYLYGCMLGLWAVRL